MLDSRNQFLKIASFQHILKALAKKCNKYLNEQKYKHHVAVQLAFVWPVKPMTHKIRCNICKLQTQRIYQSKIQMLHPALIRFSIHFFPPLFSSNPCSLSYPCRTGYTALSVMYPGLHFFNAFSSCKLRIMCQILEH